MNIAEIGITGALMPTGIGLGSVIAALCSWERNRSIIWAIIAAVLSWVYVGYYVLTRRPNTRLFYPPVPKYPLGVERERALRPASEQ